VDPRVVASHQATESFFGPTGLWQQKSYLASKSQGLRHVIAAYPLFAAEVGDSPGHPPHPGDSPARQKTAIHGLRYQTYPLLIELMAVNPRMT
jgi:hypothetical protein